jgi:acyl-coenzyme A synthetase/AMP-(fatty) acid ligase
VTASALSAALTADTDHAVSFGRDGTVRRWQDLVGSAARVAAAVAERRARRWAVQLDDTFQFAAGLLGVWAAGKTPVLLAMPFPETGAFAAAFDGVIESDSAPTRVRERLVWERLPRTKTRIDAIAPSAELVLYTSGSTGVPKEVSRRLHNIEAELAVLELLWGAEVGDALVYSTVSPRHVYGMLFSVLWPLLYRRQFATFRLEFPEQLASPDRGGHALVSSPALLKRIGHLPEGTGSWRAVFSSGGLLPAEAAADVRRVLGAFPVEVLGSTETSGVAWRRQIGGHSGAFEPMPSVDTRVDTDGLLEVRSPFSGHAGWLKMGDRVRLDAARGIELLGRGDHLAKIEDKRVSLAEIERYLRESPWIADAAAVALDDGKRQFIGAIVQLSAAGRAEVSRRGPRSFNEALKTTLRARLEPLAVPRKFRHVEAIPVDAQGKRQSARMHELFARR